MLSNKTLSACITLMVAIIFTNCSQTRLHRRYVPQELQEIAHVETAFRAVKTAWSPFDNTLYLMDADNQIYIYRNNTLVNKIGGLGFSDDNFSKLSDISVAYNGNLLALDSFNKEIKQFDRNGKFLDRFRLNDVHDPALFDVSREGVVYVYDKAVNEIVMIDKQLSTIITRFGKFYFLTPNQITINNDRLTVYDTGNQKTFIFDEFGKFVRELPSYWQVDRYGLKYQNTSNRIIYPTAEEKKDLKIFTDNYFLIKNNYLHTILGNSVKIYLIKYDESDISKQIKGISTLYESL